MAKLKSICVYCGSRPGADPDPIPGYFKGKGLTHDGFMARFETPVQLQVSCAGNWCGGAQSGGDALYYIRVDQGAYTIEARPCGGLIFDNPSAEVLDQLTACMNGQDCSAQSR